MVAEAPPAMTNSDPKITPSSDSSHREQPAKAYAIALRALAAELGEQTPLTELECLPMRPWPGCASRWAGPARNPRRHKWEAKALSA
jgi:hypothetical protein